MIGRPGFRIVFFESCARVVGPNPTEPFEFDLAGDPTVEPSEVIRSPSRIQRLFHFSASPLSHCGLSTFRAVPDFEFLRGKAPLHEALHGVD